MTYCVGMRLKDGLVALSDTRITSGNETTIAEKYKIYQKDNQHVFLMTSGLRSVRDKALTYFSETLSEKFDHYEKLYQVVNEFGNQIKKVAKEDKKHLFESGLDFSINVIVGGQMKHDSEHKLFLLYPQGNWIEIGKGHPFTIIGNSGYGTPILRRTVHYDTPIKSAIKTAFLSFDSTRVSANDVGFPIDVLVFPKDGKSIKVNRYEEMEMQSISSIWGEKLTNALDEIPDDWMDMFLNTSDS